MCSHCGRIINSAHRLGLFALHQQRTLLSHVCQSTVPVADTHTVDADGGGGSCSCSCSDKQSCKEHNNALDTTLNNPDNQLLL